jgi:hypothetical protein
MGFAGKTRSADMPEMQIAVLEQRPGEETMRTRPITFEVNENGCHICTSHVPNTGGYPTIMMSGKKVTIARYVYSQLHGEIRPGMSVCHTCDNPGCINPTHLFLGTPKDNTADMVKKGRLVSSYGERNGYHKYTEEFILKIKSDVETMSCSDVGRKHGIPIRTVTEIKNGKRWGWLTDPKEILRA